jgi:GT2 family glycosyltransferase
VSRNTNSRLLPSAPLAEEWDNLLSSFSFDGKALLDVVVPVYKGRDETLRCLFSVLATAHENPTYRLVVINDKIPDPELAKQISKLAAANAIDLIENEENLGFIRSINAGISAHPDRDVIILNSDTEVFGDWARRLRRTAYSEGRIASVTPLSNNAEICSYPRFIREFPGAFEVSDAEIDRFAAEVNDSESVVIPTGVGFCMYMRRHAIDKIGEFDHDQFGLGYGEENDWCRRAVRDHGMKNLLACDVFVRHYGSTSFGAEKRRRIEAAMRTLAKLHPDYHSIIAEFIRHDPIQPFRKKIDAARLKAAKRGRRTWLMICHNREGGTERHLQEMLTQLVDSGDLVIVCRPFKDDRNWIAFTTDQVSDCESLAPLIVDRSYSAFSEFIRVADIDVVHAQHLIDFPFSMSDLVIQACKEMKCHLFVTVHDYHTVCPRITMVNGAGLYCGEPDLATCEGCILRWGSEFGTPP